MSERLANPARTITSNVSVMLVALLSALLAAALALGLSGHANRPASASHLGSAALRAWSAPAFSSRALISAALGAHASAYRLSGSRDGALQAGNPAQHLHARFTSAGVQVHSGATLMGLALRELGYGRALHRVAPASPSANANRVLYRHASVGEWYVNEPLGLEQGFTIFRAPSAGARGPLTLALDVSGNVRASLAADSASIRFTHPGGPSLRYGALTATDTGGRKLPSRLALDAGRILVTVDTRGARFPVRVDPLVQDGEKVTSGESSEASMLGYSVAMSADGNTALVGGPTDGNSTGAVWVFVRSAGAWVQQGTKLTGTESGETEACGEGEETEAEVEQCAFGRSVALSGDGNTALVGSPREAGPCRREAGECQGQGAARVFTRSGSTWTLDSILTGGEEENVEARFGRGVALSADGTTALIGAPNDGNGLGAIWVFARSGSSWTQQGSKLTDSEHIGETHLGVSVALSADGSTALAGAPGENEHAGAAWTFTRSASSWAQQGGMLSGAGEIGRGRFGSAVALSGDGSTALVGALADNEHAGAAWAFARSGEAWTQQGAKLTDTEAQPTPAHFGASVALSADGNSALIGGPFDASGTGAAWLLARSEGQWIQQGGKLTGLENPNGAPRKGTFGYSVALRADGASALVGAPGDSGRRGALWAFANPANLPSVSAVTPTFGSIAGGTTVSIAGARLAGATAVAFESFEHRRVTSVPAAGFTVSPTGVTAVSPRAPEGRAETVYVRVTTHEGVSPASEGARFTYVADGGSPPSVPAVGTASPPAGGVLGSSTSDCNPALLSRNVRVLSRGRATVRLLWRGTRICTGKLTLRVKVKVGRHYRLKAISGAPRFTLRSGKALTVPVKLTALGRRLLGRAHGHLSASLLVVKLAPGLVRARAANVRLLVPRAASIKKAKR
ncbi:MAG: hypothetical protein QOI03_2086 [Solirubrobacteraceae bacterium]|nr:hypothetical protein [Solirubrobacteraceae bacterium]